MMPVSETDVTVVHVSDAYGHSPPNISAVVKDACSVAKDHVIPASRCQGNGVCLSNQTTTTAAVEPVPGYKDLANQRSLSDKLDLSVVSSGNTVQNVYFSLISIRPVEREGERGRKFSRAPRRLGTPPSLKNTENGVPDGFFLT